MAGILNFLDSDISEYFQAILLSKLWDTDELSSLLDLHHGRINAFAGAILRLKGELT